jgi:XTP/dITP diphosphohydrolase
VTRVSPTSRSSNACLVLGTHNRKKAAELAELFAGLRLDVVSLADFDTAIEIEESGDSFAANARLKATRQATHLHAWVLGDDSGLTVDALDGAPGIYSARFAGVGASDADNRRKLLELLTKVPPQRRTARFECHLVLADPTGSIAAESTGRCYGRIGDREAGTGGFGYDPLFEIVEYHRTFAELGTAAKNCLSHRARAMQALAPRLADIDWSRG